MYSSQFRDSRTGTGPAFLGMPSMGNHLLAVTTNGSVAGSYNIWLDGDTTGTPNYTGDPAWGWTKR